MATTTYKGYELQVTGSNSGTWGDTLNTDVLQRIDSNLGEIVTKSLASADVTLSTAESRAVIVRVTGTLTTTRTLTTSCQGFFFLENACTGAYAVTVTNGVAGVTAPQGRRVPMIADSTNGVRIAATEEFTGGTTMLFVQTSAPTGWTKSTSHNDKALRVVSGTASTGGSTAFTTVFGSRSVPTTDSTTLSTSQIPAHQHFTVSQASPTSDVTDSNYVSYFWSPASDSAYFLRGVSTAATTGLTSSTGGGTGHTHTMSTAMDFAVQYVDVIIASRDSY